VLPKIEPCLTVYGLCREYGLGASDLYITEHKKEVMLKQRVQFTLKCILHPHVYDRCQKVIEGLERLKLLMS